MRINPIELASELAHVATQRSLNKINDDTKRKSKRVI